MPATFGLAALRSTSRVAAALLLTGVAAACGSVAGSAAPTAVPIQAGPATTVWPAPPDPMARAKAAGLVPETVEHLTYHVHAHLDVFLDARRVLVPAGIGIDTAHPDVHRFDEADGSVSWGGIQGCAQPCISPLHTHADYGILHTESATTTPNRLGQLFTEWGVTLSASCFGDFCAPATTIAIYVDGTAWTGDPTAIELSDHREIAIVIGTPPATIPSTADFSLP